MSGQPVVPAANGASPLGPPTAGLGQRAQRSNDQERSATPQPTGGIADDRGSSGGLFAPADPRLPWLVVLGLGVGLLLAGIYLRFAQQPRAG